MGSADFQQIVWEADIATAFRKGREAAQHDRGFNGYSGTLGTKSSYIPIWSEPISEFEAQRLAGSAIASDERIQDKGGPAGAIALHRTIPAVIGDTRDEVVTFTVGAQLPIYPIEREAIIAKHVKLKRGEKIDRFGVTEVAERTFRTTVTATKGATETRYFIMVAGETKMPDWKSGYASQAEARGKIEAWLAAPEARWLSPDVDLEIVAMTRRADTQPLVTVSRRIKSMTVNINIRIIRETVPEQTVPGVAGWLFFGWAPC